MGQNGRKTITFKLNEKNINMVLWQGTAGRMTGL